MAIIASPFQNPTAGSRNPYVEWDMQPVHPGQSLVVGRHSGKASATGRGPAHYEGSCAWQPKDDLALRELERFFQDLQGFVNTTRLQLPGKYAAQGLATNHGTITVSAAAVVPADHAVEVTLAWTGAEGPDIRAGDYLNIGERLYAVKQGTNAGGADKVKVTPVEVPDTTAIVKRTGLTVLARASSDGQGSLLTQGWRNRRVLFQWREEV